MPDYMTADTEYELPPAGLHAAVCVDYIDEGFKPTKFGDKHKVRYVFQIDEKNSQGRRHTVSAWFNKSLHEEASLRKFLEQWRGRPFGEELNRPPGFDLESVVGKPCVLNIIHNASGGKTYANIASVSAMTTKFGLPLEPENYIRKQDREEQEQTPVRVEKEEEEPIPF